MLQEMTHSIKPKRALKEFMKRENALGGCGLERGGELGGVQGGGRAFKEKETQAEITSTFSNLKPSGADQLVYPRKTQASQTRADTVHSGRKPKALASSALNPESKCWA